MWFTLSKIFVFPLLFVGVLHAQINPASQIVWPRITGTVNPTSPTWPCTSTYYGEPYTNTATNMQFVCSAGGWTAVSGTGPTGATGATGQTGSTGATGNTGSTGQTGNTGLAGTTGTTGTTGTAGSTGATGATGVSGATGATGNSGSNGNTGQTGNTGLAGVTGFTGATGQTGATGVSGATGTATLPSGVSGQIITNVSTGSTGTTYSAQPQIVYQQSGDTIASIEASSQCSSACTYVVTFPQTITLAANHTLSSNVNLQFNAGGLWTVNGAFTLTLGNISGTLNQHFAGTSTIAGLSGAVPVEWFGAISYSTITAAAAGTDSTTAIQTAINSITRGGWAQLTCNSYRTTAALSITTSVVGIHGTCQGYSYPSASPVSIIVSTSASADIVDVVGASGTYIVWNDFRNVTFQRSVVPTGTAKGLSCQYAGGVQMENVQSEDSIYDFYANGCPGYGTGAFRNVILELQFC